MSSPDLPIALAREHVHSGSVPDVHGSAAAGLSKIPIRPGTSSRVGDPSLLHSTTLYPGELYGNDALV